MIRRDVLIANRLGLHARAASRLVKVASDFRAEIGIEKDGARADAKSIMGLLLLAAARGQTVTITADGEDEAAALAAVADLFAQKFLEE